MNTAYLYDINRRELSGDRCSSLLRTIPYTLTGTSQPDTIKGESGDDSLSGGGGDDLLDGQSGDSTLNGGAGVDRYVIAYQDNQSVLIQDWDVENNDFFEHLILPSDQHYVSGIEEIEYNGQSSIQIDVAAVGDPSQVTTGTTILEGISFTSDLDFPVSLENVILGSSQGDDERTKAVMGGWNGFFVGDHDDPADDIMVGHDGSDVLDGGGGDDTMYGREGVDIFHLATDDHDADEEYLIVKDFSVDESEGRDFLYIDPGYEIKEIFEVDEVNSPVQRFGIVLHVGPVGKDTSEQGGITGRSFMDGISLQDFELNWDPEDVQNLIIGTRTHDDATDQSLFGGAPTTVDGREIKLFSGTDAHEKMFGREDNDQLEGNAGHDTLDGGEGADTLIGGLGNDVFVLRSDTARVDGGAGEDLIETAANVAALGLKNVKLGDGADRLINRGAMAVAGSVDLGAGNDRFETTTYLQAQELDGGKGKNDQLILNAPNVEDMDDSLLDQLTGFESSFAVQNFETIRQIGGEWAFDGALEGVDLVIEGGSLQANLEAKNQIAITMDQLNFDSGDFIIDASNVLDDLRGRWRLVRTRKPIDNLEELTKSTVLVINDEQQPLGLNAPMSLDCAPYVFELSQNQRGTALFLDVSL